MRRVSSRQRLVSWDAFDAAVRNDSDSEQVGALSEDSTSTGELSVEDLNVSSRNTALTHSTSDSLLHRKRKKYIKTAQSPSTAWVAPHVIAAFPSEVSSNSSACVSLRSAATRKNAPKPIALLTAVLSQDAQLHVMGFLNEQDTRNMMEVNHHFRHLLQNSRHVWKGLARQRWPFLHEEVQWIDRLHLPQTVPGLGQEEEINMSLLLHLAAETKASHIDESIFQPCSKSRNAVLRRQQQNRGTLGRSMLTNGLRTVMMRDGESTAVQFTGRIGFGDRCIRANQPLPRPHHLTKKQMRSLRKLGFNSLSFWERLLRRRDEDSPQWRPFVAPFSLADGTISLTPRLISYFEVHIINTKEMHPDTPSVEHPHGLQLHRVRATSHECVAVGISLSNFHLHSRMPGWDAVSYGFHGDDGGVFHDSGRMIREFGPTFGVGDVVGCGIDYQAERLFYTLNGRFLGYAFLLKQEELLMDWYPTVGVDTNSLVQCNFGTDRPFAFDLQCMIEKDRATLVQTVGPHEL